MIPANPELRRNIWLEMTTARLVVIPTIVGAVYLIIHLGADDKDAFFGGVRYASAMMLALFLMLWGVKQAAEAVIAEVNERTWDSQRLTSAGPLAMTVGKMFGSTICAWYGGLICAAGYLLAALQLPDRAENVKILIMMLIVALFMQALALVISLSHIRKNDVGARLHTGPTMLLGIVFLIMLPQAAPLIMASSLLPWYIWRPEPLNFAIASALFFTAWSIVGVYRGMRAEFRMSAGPWTWIIFLATFMLYHAGFTAGITGVDSKTRVMIALIICFSIGIFWTYVTAFIEPKNPVTFRRALQAAGERDWREAGQTIPLWALSLGMTLALWAGLSVWLMIMGDFHMPGEELSLSLAFLATITAFLLRDIFLLLWVNLSSGTARADAATIIYLLILYGLLPGVFFAAGFKRPLPLFWPMLNAHPAWGLIPAVAEAAVVFYLLLRCWRRRHAGAGAPAGQPSADSPPEVRA